MNKQDLTSLRESILKDIVPLVLESSDSGADRFSLLLRIIQAGNATGDLYRQAYESAKKIESTEERLEALLALLDEVDFDANLSEDAASDVEQATASTSEPLQEMGNLSEQ